MTKDDLNLLRGAVLDAVLQSKEPPVFGEIDSSARHRLSAHKQFSRWSFRYTDRSLQWLRKQNLIICRKQRWMSSRHKESR